MSLTEFQRASLINGLIAKDQVIDPDTGSPLDWDALGGASDQDLTDIAALTPSNNDVMQRKSGAWTNRTIAQLLSDLGIAAAYQPLDSDLTAIAALTTTSFGRSLLASADASALQTLAGVSTFIKTLLDDADAATARATLGVTGLSQAYAGYNTIGGTVETPGVNGKVYAKSFTLAAAGFIGSIGAYLEHASGNAMGPSVALYTDSSGPANVIGHGSPVAALMNLAGGARWVDVPIGVYAPAGTYWAAVRIADTGGSVLMKIHYDGSGSDRTGAASGLNQWVDWSAMGSTATSSNKYSIRASVLS